MQLCRPDPLLPSNSGAFGELALAQLLEFAKNPDGLTNRDFDSFLGRAKLFHFRASGNREE